MSETNKFPFETCGFCGCSVFIPVLRWEINQGAEISADIS